MIRIRRWLISLAFVLGWTPAHGNREVIEVLDRTPALDQRLPDQPVANHDHQAHKDWEEEIRQTPTYRVAYRQAHAEALMAIKQANARLFTQRMGFGMSGLDPETGLPAEIIAACVMSTETLGRLEGNNNGVHAWIKKHGVPANSLLRWKEELSDLPGFFEAKSKAGASIPLRPGGPTLRSPDGRFTIRQLAIQIRTGSPPEIPAVFITGLEVSDRGVIRDTLQDEWQRTMTDLVWGPAGVPFAVVKYQFNGEPAFTILHLQPVAWLSGGELSWQHYLKDHPEAR